MDIFHSDEVHHQMSVWIYTRGYFIQLHHKLYREEWIVKWQGLLLMLNYSGQKKTKADWEELHKYFTIQNG